MADQQHPVAPEESEDTKGPSKSELKKRAKEEEKAKKKAEKAAKLEEQAKEAARKKAEEDANDESAGKYGKLPLIQSQERPRRTYASVAKLASLPPGSAVVLRARIHTSRAQGAKMVFLMLRQRTESVQALLAIGPGVSKQMLRWAAGLSDESIVLVEGTVQPAPEEVKSATIGSVEVHVQKLYLVVELASRLPFTIEDAQRPESDFEATDSQYNRVLLDTRLNNRVVDLRTQTNQAIFRLQAAITDLFREFLTGEGFTEIHSPKLQNAATESGASVFKVSYFKGSAYLAQSPQLAKQMAIAADFERVFEIGPVFRAEDSNTHRHMTEFMGVDLEMAVNEHYHEAMELTDELFKSIFRGLRDKWDRDVKLVNRQFPAEEFKWRDGPEGTLRLTFSDAVDLLVEDGVAREELDDINTENEKRLGRIVKAKYDTDYFIVDKFPLALRPFYTMPDPNDPTLSNSYDFFMRGEEILSGAQRIHDPVLLEAKMREKGIDPESMRGYLDGFKYGCPPHGGAGIGLERVLMLYLKLGNIRRASMFPRDPKRLEP